MRIGTWNMEGRCSDRHLELLESADCDVWLLTEVSDPFDLPGYFGPVTGSPMREKVQWAGVFSRTPPEPLPDPHPASAMARIGETTFVSSILPWTGTGDVEPWHGENHAARTRHTLDTLLAALPDGDLCWGGDWNHAFSGPEYAGSKGGREAIKQALVKLGLSITTAELPQALEGLLSIDHIAVPSAWKVSSAERIATLTSGARLSDHDLYVVLIDDEVQISSAP